MEELEYWKIYSLYLFLYKAFESSVQFEVHAEGISLDIEIRSYLHRFEVRMIRAVTPTGDCYKLTIEDLRATNPARTTGVLTKFF